MTLIYHQLNHINLKHSPSVDLPIDSITRNMPTIEPYSSKDNSPERERDTERSNINMQIEIGPGKTAVKVFPSPIKTDIDNTSNSSLKTSSPDMSRTWPLEKNSTSPSSVSSSGTNNTQNVSLSRMSSRSRLPSNMEQISENVEHKYDSPPLGNPVQNASGLQYTPSWSQLRNTNDDINPHQGQQQLTVDMD